MSDLVPLLRAGARYFITSPGGYGKTTLCAYLCRIKAKERIEDPQNPLPVFLQLRYYRSKDGGLDRLISDAVVPGAFATIFELQNELKSGACVLFLDGLNEAPEAERDDIFKDLIRLSRANSKLAIVVTSRDLDTPEGFAPHFSGLRLKPFSPVQIKTYLASRAPDRRSSLEAEPSLLQSPLILYLVVSLEGFRPDPRWNIGRLYWELTSALLHRELEKQNLQSNRDLFWSDLCRLASRLEETPPSRQFEVTRPIAAEWIKQNRFDPDNKRAFDALNILRSSGLLRSVRAGSDAISFLHSSLQSFFYAVAILDNPSPEKFHNFLEQHTGDIQLTYVHRLDGTTYNRRWLTSKSAEMREVLTFAWGLVRDWSDSIRDAYLSERFLKHDPLLAPVCLSLFERRDALSLIAESFGFSDQSKDKGPYSFMLEAHKPVIVDEQEDVTLDVEGAETITADEVAFQIIRARELDEFVSQYFVHLCKSMRRDIFPYSSYRGMEGWGGQRFLTLLERMRRIDRTSSHASLQHIADKYPSKEERIANRPKILTLLEKMVPDKKAVAAIHEVLESGSVYERQNAALVLGYFILEEFYQLRGGFPIGVWDGLHLDSVEIPEIVDSRPPYEDTWDRRVLIRSFVNAIPSVMPVGQLEGVLRILLLYEAVVVIEPRESALQQGKIAGNTDSDGLVSQIVDLWWQSDSDGNPDDLVSHVRWSVSELSGLITRLQQDMIGRLGDELQQADAARAIIRLYSETLWARKQDFGRKISRMPTVKEAFEDEETEERWWFADRYFSDFLSIMPVSPVDRGDRAAVEFLKSELAFRSSDDDDEVTRALRILLSTYNPTEARRFPE